MDYQYQKEELFVQKELEHRWGQEQAADLAQRQGWKAHQSGYRKLDLIE